MKWRFTLFITGKVDITVEKSRCDDPDDNRNGKKDIYLKYFKI